DRSAEATAAPDMTPTRVAQTSSQTLLLRLPNMMSELVKTEKPADTANATAQITSIVARPKIATAMYFARSNTPRLGCNTKNFTLSRCCQSEVIARIEIIGAPMPAGNANAASIMDMSIGSLRLAETATNATIIRMPRSVMLNRSHRELRVFMSFRIST